MIGTLLLGVALAATPAPLDGPALAGHRIAPIGTSTGVSLSHGSVVGPDGGTSSTTVSAFAHIGPVAIGAALPFAAYPTPDGRHTDLGNLHLGAWWLSDLGGFSWAFGVEGHVSVADRAYTWVNDGTELWPGAGIDAVVQLSRGFGRTTLLGRGSVGGHGARGYAPYPKAFFRGQLAVAIDEAVHERVGLVAEMAVTVWDPSPWEIAALVRVDPTKGLRARVGLVMPLGVWAGWSPARRADDPTGPREVTLRADLTAAF